MRRPSRVAKRGGPRAFAAPGENLRMTDPSTETAIGQALIPEQLLRMDRPISEAVIASVFQVRRRLHCLLLGSTDEGPPVILATVAVRFDLVPVLGPDTTKLSFVRPASGTHNVHEPPHGRFASESAVAADDRDIVHVERHRLRRQPNLVPFSTVGAVVVHLFVRFDHNGGITVPTDNSRSLREERVIAIKVLNWASAAAAGTAVLEELERRGLRSLC